MSIGRRGDNESRPLEIAVICTPDGFANSGKPRLIKEILSERGQKVTIIDTSYLSRASQKGLLRFLPSLQPTKLGLYLLGGVARVLQKLPRRVAGTINAVLFIQQMQLRARVLARAIAKMSPDAVVCETQEDSGIMRLDIGNIKKIYNCATPLAAELYFGGSLSELGYERLKKYEVSIYEASDHLSFHWHCYADYVRKHYGYDGDNIFLFDRNAITSDVPATYSQEPRIVYMGYLGGYWIDPELLSELTRIYPAIDVYGLPEPSPKLGLNYRGYATPEILRNYQFGLITCSKDLLRREGFSAKHVDYLAAGLPVLIPEWRTATRDLKGTVTYNVQNFLDQLRDYAMEDTWKMLSKEALAQADELSAEKVSAEFVSIVESINRKA